MLATLPLGAAPGLAQRPGGQARLAWIAPVGGARSDYDALSEGLRERGYDVQQALAVQEFNLWTDGSNAADIADAIRRGRFDVVVTSAVTTSYMFPLLDPAQPLVFGFSGDPVEAGLVRSLARPGGNATGVSLLALELVGKRMELLKEVRPTLKRVALLANAGHPGERAEYREASNAAAQLGVEAVHVPVRGPADFEGALARAGREHVQGIDVFPDALMVGNAGVIADYALRTRTPTISGWPSIARAGNLMSYGPSVASAWKQAAGHIERILKGASPGDLPVELPTRVLLTVNLKTARAIGITIPPSIIARADEVIE
jgi:putative tryptophan/tyrosine transport system substrate-binding protein